MDYRKLWLKFQKYLAKNPEQETLHKTILGEMMRIEYEELKMAREGEDGER